MPARRRAFHRVAGLIAGALVGGAVAARAETSLVVRQTELHDPPDSHEPQRATVAVRNMGADVIANAQLTCTFEGAGGSILATQAVSVPAIAGRTDARAEAIYYGWPRASRAACWIAEPR